MEKAHRHLLKVSRPYPRLHSAIKTNGRLSLQGPDTDLFTFLCQTMVSQQLSVKAADTIWGRVMELKRKRRLRQLTSLMQDKYREALRECGISGRKTESLIRLAAAFKSGDVDPDHIRHACHDEIVTLIAALYGFGPWSAEMVSMFYANQPDVWSPGDVSLVRGLKNLLDESNDPEPVIESFTPYRSYLALHIWHCEDNAPPIV